MYEFEPDGQPHLVLPARVRITPWKQQVDRAVEELDPMNLTLRVHAAEWAMFQRWQELAAGGGTVERIAMAAAVDDLLSIKIHKLKWPGFRVNS